MPRYVVPVLGLLELSLLGVGFWLVNDLDWIWAIGPFWNGGGRPDAKCLALFPETTDSGNGGGLQRHALHVLGQLSLSSLNAFGAFKLFDRIDYALAYYGMEGHIQDMHVIFFQYQYQTGWAKGPEPGRMQSCSFRTGPSV